MRFPGALDAFRAGLRLIPVRQAIQDGRSALALRRGAG